MTRKQGKGYLRSDFLCEPGADSPHSLELLCAAERSEGVTVGDDARRERRAHSAKRLDLVSAREIHVDDRRDERLIWSLSCGFDCRLRFRRPGAPTLRFFSALFLARDPLPGGVDGFYLCVERAACGGVRWCVAMEDCSAACAGTEQDDGAEEEQRFSLARGRHDSLYRHAARGWTSNHLGQNLFPAVINCTRW